MVGARARLEQITCLSFSPINRISSMRVSLGCLFLSALSLMSRGSKAILCPFSELSYEVSGPVLLSSFRLVGAGELTLLPSSSSTAPAPPLRRVRPEVEAMSNVFGATITEVKPSDQGNDVAEPKGGSVDSCIRSCGAAQEMLRGSCCRRRRVGKLAAVNSWATRLMWMLGWGATMDVQEFLKTGMRPSSF